MSEGTETERVAELGRRAFGYVKLWYIGRHNAFLRSWKVGGKVSIENREIDCSPPMTMVKREVKNSKISFV